MFKGGQANSSVICPHEDMFPYRWTQKADQTLSCMIEQTKVGFFELYNISSVKVILTSVIWFQ
jgi:hypothetical protein